MKGDVMFKFTSHNECDTMNFAMSLASFLHKGDVVVLSGDLGAGKTKFTEGFLSFFNLQDEISSPTFTIVNEYTCDNSDDINTNQNTNIYHFDVYRLNDIDEFYAIGGEEYFDNGICIIEWGELIKDALPKEYIHITINRSKNNEHERIFTIETYGDRFYNIIQELMNNIGGVK